LRKDFAGINAAYFCNSKAVCSMGARPTFHQDCGAFFETFKDLTAF
jgi:hypothetical protein